MRKTNQIFPCALVRPYKSDDALPLKLILDASLGDGYFDCRWLDAENCLVADNRNPIGLIFGERIDTCMEIRTIVVNRLFRGSGIASRLMEAFIEKCKADGIIYLWSPAWVNGNNIPAANLLDRHGFNRSEMISDYWTADSLLRKYDCPSCGNPCHCSAVIFKRNVWA